MIDAINNAKEREIQSVVDYTEVAAFNMDDVDGITTGFADLDAAMGKLFCGTTNLITGITGSGKSSFLSTLINQSIDQGFPVFVYSGELNNQLLKSWLDYVHAGQANLTSDVKDGRITYRVKPEAIEKINQFYKGQLYFYKDTESPQVSHILESIEASVKRYGIRTVVIDNLTAVDLEATEDNKYHKQDAFIRECVNLARKLDIILLIVLHPKKMDTVRPVDLFDLSGVTSSANLAHRIFSLYRVQESDREPGKNGRQKPYTNCDVQVRIIKDRFGSALGKILPTYYDIPSRRFYDTPDTLAHHYSWDKEKHKDELPFFDMQRFLEVSGQAKEPF